MGNGLRISFRNLTKEKRDLLWVVNLLPMKAWVTTTMAEGTEEAIEMYDSNSFCRFVNPGWELNFKIFFATGLCVTKGGYLFRGT